MAKQRIKLDLDSSDILDFEREVSIPTPDGRELKIPFTFKYRDRIAIAQLFDGFMRAIKDDAKRNSEQASSDDPPPIADGVAIAIESDADTIFDVASGWGVESPFTRDNLVKFVTRYPGAAVAVLLDYRVSLTQGRLGN